VSPAARALRPALRIGAAAALMAAAVWLVGPQRLQQQWAQVDRSWFVLAVAVMALSQAVSIARWNTIARIFGLQVRTGTLALAYAQGMTLNVLLPGATLSGDALRSLRLQRLGNPLGVSALTVLLDRLSGLWVLCVLSLVTALGLGLTVGLQPAAADAAAPAAAARGGVEAVLASGYFAGAYLAGLGLLVAIPWLPLPGAAHGGAGDVPRPWLARTWRRVAGLHALAMEQRVPLGRSLWSSLLVQVLCAVTLWLCLRAAGGHAAYWQVQAIAAPVFVAGALPISYGGFGARELAALVAFPLVGLPADAGVAASLLYGLVGIVLGLAAAPSFAIAAPAPESGKL